MLIGKRVKLFSMNAKQAVDTNAEDKVICEATVVAVIPGDAEIMTAVVVQYDEGYLNECSILNVQVLPEPKTAKVNK